MEDVPRNDESARQGAPEDQITTTAANRSTLAAESNGPRWPSDLRMTGYVLDPLHRKTARALIRNTRNLDARNLLRAWRRSGYAFCVVGGHLHSANGPTIGGLASSWNAALALFRAALWRFDTLVDDGTGFSSAWVFFTTRDRHEQARAMVAELQQTAGNA